MPYLCNKATPGRSGNDSDKNERRKGAAMKQGAFCSEQVTIAWIVG
jgi:hypothetical protein